MSGQLTVAFSWHFPLSVGFGGLILTLVTPYVPALPKLVAVLPPVSLSITVVIGSVATDGLGAFRLYAFLFSLFCSSS